jgi:hypothetical protein
MGVPPLEAPGVWGTDTIGPTCCGRNGGIAMRVCLTSIIPNALADCDADRDSGHRALGLATVLVAKSTTGVPDDETGKRGPVVVGFRASATSSTGTDDVALPAAAAYTG